jgi:hypothetical protein
LGFMTKSVFWLGLVYSSMPFERGSAPAIAPGAWPGQVAAGARETSEERRNAVDKLRLAAEVADSSFGARDLLLRTLIKPRSKDTPASKDLSIKDLLTKGPGHPAAKPPGPDN